MYFITDDESNNYNVSCNETDKMWRVVRWAGLFCEYVIGYVSRFWER